MRLAQIGFGGLGTLVADALRGDAGCEYVAIAARAQQRDKVHAVLPGVTIVGTPEALLASRPELVIECASHEAFRQYAGPVLAGGIDLVAVSIGVLAETAYRERVLDTAARAGSRLEIPSGAIGAIDAISSARHAGLTRVVYSTRKSPRAWKGTPAETMVDLASVREPVCFFDDTAERAALLFTEKANVTATLALAGIGFEATRVEFWVDPAVTRSVHRIEAEGACGRIAVDLANTVAPSDGRASLLTAMSIVQAVRRRCAVLRV